MTLQETLAVRAAISLAPESGLLDKLLVISKVSRALLGVHLAEIGLNVGQDQMIAQLSAQHPSTVGAVADGLNVRPSTVSKMADRLRTMGLVEKGAVARDARCTELFLTEAGEAMKARVKACWRDIESQLVRAYPILEDASLRRSLHDIEAILRQRLARLR